MVGRLSFYAISGLAGLFFPAYPEGCGFCSNRPVTEIVGNSALVGLIRVGFFFDIAAVEPQAAADPARIIGRIVGSGCNFLKGEIADSGNIAVEIDLPQAGAAGEGAVTQHLKRGREVNGLDGGAILECHRPHLHQVAGEDNFL